jgi:malate dehydrogenase
MVDAILKDTNQIHSCAMMLQGEYGYSDIVSGVPVMIGMNGGEKIIEMSLNDLQRTRFKNSVASVQEMVDALCKNKFFDDCETSNEQ